MSMTPSGRYPQYRAPTGDGQTLCAPPWNETSELLSSNRAQLEARSGELHGRSFLELAQAARAAVLTAAVAYTRSYADVEVAADSDRPLILTGHQPGFVHPGVWLKNFAAARLAKDAGGVAISLVIDSDLCRSTSIGVPTGGVEHPRGEQVAYDQMTAQVPYEERRIADLSTWQSFGSRTSKTIAPLVSDPLIHQWWPEAVGGGQAQGMLAPAMSQTRHQLELAWHAGSLEIPHAPAAVPETSARSPSRANLRYSSASTALMGVARDNRMRSGGSRVPDRQLRQVHGFVWRACGHRPH